MLYSCPSCDLRYGGRDIDPGAAKPGENSGNEINGITLAGVGSKTVVDHCEVAFNQDDGFEMARVVELRRVEGFSVSVVGSAVFVVFC